MRDVLAPQNRISANELPRQILNDLRQYYCNPSSKSQMFICLHMPWQLASTMLTCHKQLTLPVSHRVVCYWQQYIVLIMKLEVVERMDFSPGEEGISN